MLTQILFFSAPCCNQCKALHAALAQESARLHFDNTLYIDAEEREDLAMLHHVRNLPTLIFMENGREIGRATGVMAYKDLEKYM